MGFIVGFFIGGWSMLFLMIALALLGDDER